MRAVLRCLLILFVLGPVFAGYGGFPIQSVMRDDSDFYDTTNQEATEEPFSLPVFHHKIDVEDIYSYIESAGLDIGAMTLTTFAEIFFITWLQHSGLITYNSFVPASYCPHWFWQTSRFIVRSTTGKVNRQASQYFGETVRLIVSAPLFEEFMWRFLIQKVLLTEIPREVLQRIAPQYAHYSDSQLIKFLRTAFVGSLFGVGHILDLNPPPQLGRFRRTRLPAMAGVSPTVGGLIMGTLLEQSSTTPRGLARAVFVHMLNNLYAISHRP